MQLLPGGGLYGVLARNQGAGIHQDAYADARGIPVEQEKPSDEQAP